MSDSRPSSERIEKRIEHILISSRFFRATSTRRTFMSHLLAVGGSAALGASAGAALISLRAGSAFGDDEDVTLIEPKPIPGGFFPFADINVISHHFRPARGIEASTITDFNGFIGLAEIRGTGTGTNTMTGATMPLFFGLDNRFMVGEFVGSDGEVHRGAFAEIWMDLNKVNQDGSRGPQIHDFNPGIPTSGFSRGLFWTQHIPIDSVTVDLGDATASLELRGLPVKDFFTGRNSFLNVLPPNQQPPGVIPPVPAFLDLTMRWSGVKARVDITDFEDTGLTSNHRFAGAFIEDTATIQWSVTVPTMNFEFQSDSTKTFESEFAEIGRERNGVFFRPGRID